MVSLSELFKRAGYLADKNSAGILTGIGTVGVITTAVLSGKATIKAYEMVLDEERERFNEAIKENKDITSVEMLSTEQRIRLTWHVYIPPIISGVSTVLAIILANRMASKEIAALAAAYAISDRALLEYKEKVVEKLGQGKEQAIRAEIAQARYDANPPAAGVTEVILAGTGDVLCMDILTGRYFQSSMEKIRAAENKVNFEIVNHGYSSLSVFYDEIGLPPTGMSDILGFNLDNRLEIKFNAVVSTDQRPCMTIDFHFPPVPDYGKHVY